MLLLLLRLSASKFANPLFAVNLRNEQSTSVATAKSKSTADWKGQVLEPLCNARQQVNDRCCACETLRANGSLLILPVQFDSAEAQVLAEWTLVLPAFNMSDV